MTSSTKPAHASSTNSASALKSAVQAQRALAERLFTTLADGSQGNPGIMRDTFGPGENFAHGVLTDFAAEAGLSVSKDFAANTYVTWRGSEPNAPRILMGSHLDSVPHGGNFDGAAGVIAGLVVIEALRSLGVRPRRDVTVMGVRAEESVWFQVSYVGSRSALGRLPDGALEAKRIDNGKSLAAHITECGGDPEVIRRRQRHLDPATIRAFSRSISSRRRPSSNRTFLLPSVAEFRATSVTRRHGSLDATTMSGRRAASATTRRWRVPSLR